MSKLVIWDVDGTLVDTAELHFEAWLKLCTELGRSFDRADFAATFGKRNPEIFAYLFPGRFADADVLRLGTLKEEYYKAEARHGVDSFRARSGRAIVLMALRSVPGLGRPG